jgi:type IV pilus assembly protein PilE
MCLKQRGTINEIGYRLQSEYLSVNYAVFTWEYLMKTSQGLTLIELLIVISIIGILSAIAFPSYQRYLTQARRTDGQTALMDLAARMEHYAIVYHHYSKEVLSNNQSPEGWYHLNIPLISDTDYALEAIPQKAQADTDKACGTLTLNHLGQKGHSGEDATKKCW